ncbi:sugar transferase [Candidatus Pelagibacter sp.]|uniref:sugar transferase n=1 Tax=Candidatus Pelagibacter sp. TaxID=2024849 RepID=UPI003F8545B9
MSKLINIFLAIIFLIILSPLMFIIFILIKLDSKGPVFFISERVGKNNQSFKMIKFRTMHFDTEIIESAKLKNHKEKITKIGKILRKFSIDEIPQFISVILGKMSIVGPRPALPSQKKLIEKRKRLGISKILPGITGIAQINGRDFISDEKKLYFELEYLKKKSFLLDMMIIFKTIKVVLSKTGVSH